jgi:hypothetical protein
MPRSSYSGLTHHSGIPARESSQFCLRANTTSQTGRSPPDTPIFIPVGERPPVMDDLFFQIRSTTGRRPRSATVWLRFFGPSHHFSPARQGGGYMMHCWRVSNSGKQRLGIHFRGSFRTFARLNGGRALARAGYARHSWDSLLRLPPGFGRLRPGVDADWEVGGRLKAIPHVAPGR